MQFYQIAVSFSTIHPAKAALTVRRTRLDCSLSTSPTLRSATRESEWCETSSPRSRATIYLWAAAVRSSPSRWLSGARSTVSGAAGLMVLRDSHAQCDVGDGGDSRIKLGNVAVVTTTSGTWLQGGYTARNPIRPRRRCCMACKRVSEFKVRDWQRPGAGCEFRNLPNYRAVKTQRWHNFGIQEIHPSMSTRRPSSW